MNQITNAVALAFANVDSGIATLAEAGYKVSFSISYVPPTLSTRTASAGRVAEATVAEAAAATSAPAYTPTPSSVAASMGPAPTPAPEAPAPAPEAEAEAKPGFDVEARLQALIGTKVGLLESDRTSSGFKLDSSSTFTGVLCSVLEGGYGYINVYKNTLGTDVHATLSKAQHYATNTVIGQVAVNW